MNKIEKLDLYTTQLILNTKNNKYDDNEIDIGKIHKHITYIKNNPLAIKINNNKNSFNCKTNLDSNQKCVIQYINRLYQTPFYVSYISNKDLNLKIIDFYEWNPHTSIYRLFIFKIVNFELINQILNLKLEFSTDLSQSSENTIKINDIIFKFSKNIRITSNKINIEIPINSETIVFSWGLDFYNNNLSFTLDSVINKFHNLLVNCKSNHISNFFINKSMNAERKLDELWFQQKFIQPDLLIDEQLIKDNDPDSVIKFWINDFYNYFNINNKLSIQPINNSRNYHNTSTSIELLDYLPSTTEILNFYLNSDFQNEEIIRKVQEWWDVYSLPLFEFMFKEKCVNYPEEVFAMFFLAIWFKLPWANLLFKQIENSFQYSAKNSLYNFLLLLAFFYKRITKRIINNVIYFSPGYYWDNNYKSLIDHTSQQKYEYTKFSKIAYSKVDINSNNSFKINKLCRIKIESKNKNISIYPWLYKGKIKLNGQGYSKIVVDDYTINFPLVWQQGFFEFKYLKLKWLLKKNRFQITLHSSKKRRIYINNNPIDLIHGKKNIHYIEIPQENPQLHLLLFNNRGGTKFSQNLQHMNPILISGFGYTKFGIITDNILYSENIKKHHLFLKNTLCNDVKMITTDKNIQKIKFYTKHTMQCINISYFDNNFIDNFVHLNFRNRNKLLLKIDYKFSKYLKIILTFFEKNLGFQPEYILFNKLSKIQFRSNLIIVFKHAESALNIEKYYIDGKNCFRLKGEQPEILLMNLKRIIINSIKNRSN
jgi:hypothetical protein